ncbi:MAG: nuclear transport factor 2 family protein [Desulfuromonadales bacterium]|nr:nuclear transport factor 2 family protein [Desulfuromonadales bacterium]MBN2793361.1 nuclear transport factor 2 family protein [Desulfuromonadales bacterium]
MKHLEHFKTVYQELNRDSLDKLESIYAPDIHFIDPAHRIKGFESLSSYFSSLYQNLDSIIFTFETEIVSGNHVVLTWSMKFSHPRIAKGRPVCVEGCSWLEFNNDGKVIFHRDYFDMGAMLYEHLPLLGRIITKIKRGLGT